MRTAAFPAKVIKETRIETRDMDRSAEFESLVKRADELKRNGNRQQAFHVYAQAFALAGINPVPFEEYAQRLGDSGREPKDPQK
jgi:hypothetical protein